jgi:tyrosine-protein phosphatase YwqE
MFNFLFKSGKVSPDLSFIGVDMHSHLLPGIDDGLQEIEDTISYIQQLQSLGYKKLICTPHILSDLYPNSRDTILPVLDSVREALAKANIDMPIDAAAEYMIDHSFAELISSTKKAELLTINGQFILIEMSYLAASPNFEQVVFDLRMLGLTPILAHPERYSYYHHDFEMYERFADLGCKLQINLLSLSGAYGPSVKKTAELLFKKQMVDFLGTDIHHSKHLELLHKLAAKKEFYEMVQRASLMNKQLLTQ